MLLENEFARILHALPDMDEESLAQADLDIRSANVDLRNNAARLRSGELPAQIEQELLRVLPFNAARIALAQAIDKACEVRVSRFARKEEASGGPETTGWLNTNPEQGLVLSMATVDGTIEGDVDDEPGGLRGFFDNLLYVPAWVQAAHPDIEGIQSERIRLRFERPSLADDPAFDGDQPVAIGYVPLDETEDDLSFDLRNRGARACYSAQPRSLAQRLIEALGRLGARGTQLVIVPEAALRATDLPTVQEALEHIGRRPGCRIIAVFIGIAAPPDAENARALNEVVVLSRYGKEVARQRKLTHWNLSPGQQRRYGLDGHANPGEALWEDTDAGDTLTVLELPHIGRVAIHICADLQAKEPANWVRRNMTLDWSITPLMDSTLTYELDKWVFRRALEAARSGRTQAVVAASLVLTQRQNRVNRGSGALERCTNHCGLLLLLDGRFGNIQGLLVQEQLRTVPATAAVANLILHPGARPLVRRCRIDVTGQHAPRECLIIEGEDLWLIKQARLVSRTADHSPAIPHSIVCEVAAAENPDTLHLVYDRPAGQAVDENWDLHIIGTPSTSPSGQTIITFNTTKIPKTS